MSAKPIDLQRESNENLGMRQIILDTETTGLSPKQGHRIIEVGCVEMINRRLTGNHFHYYINPGRDVDDGAIAVHGITNEFLADKPKFSAVADELLRYIDGAELVIHNAPFDVGFLNHEFRLYKKQAHLIDKHCTVLDTLLLARQKHPGQRNNLDALCQRYFIDNTNRELHGALLDAEILAQVYLAMTGGQTTFFSTEAAETSAATAVSFNRVQQDRAPLKVIKANEAELAAHREYMSTLRGR